MLAHPGGFAMTIEPTVAPTRTRLVVGFLAGLAIGALGGLIGLGGAEIRLPGPPSNGQAAGKPAANGERAQ